MIAVFAGVTAALGQLPSIPTPYSGVPITAQSLGVMLAGAVLGARRGAASQALFLALVALGLPLLAGGRGGIGVFAGPTVGFLVGFVVVAALIGWATERVGAPYRVVPGLIINAGIGVVALYACGIVGMMIVTQMPLPASLLAMIPFLPGGAVKVLIATFVARGVHAAYPGLLPVRRPSGTA